VRASFVLLLVAIPAVAWAEPKVAVAPLANDDGGRIGDVVADAAGDRAKVTKQGRVEGAMRSLGVGVLTPKSLKKLRTKLDVDVVIYGSVEKDGSDKRLSLSLAGGGKSKLEVRYKSAKKLREELAAKLPKKIAAAMQGGGGDDEVDDRRARRDDEDRRKKAGEERRREEARARRDDDRREREAERRREEARARRDGDRGKRETEQRRADRKRENDDDRRKKRRDEDDDDRRASKKRRRDDDDDERDRRRKRLAGRDDEERTDELDDEEADDRRRKKTRRGKQHVLTQSTVWLDAGMAFARRTLTYDATGMMRPPRVGTAAPAARIEGEVYPATLLTPRPGAAAGAGIVAAYSRAFALGIAVPGTQIVAPISNGHYALGGRYRFLFGQHSLAVGLSYWRSHYIADRSQLMNPEQLDMPDVDYSAIAPGIAARIGVTPIASAFATVDVPLMLYSGPIQDPTSYGSSKILAFDIRAGAQVVLATHVALQVGIDFEQVALTFTGQAGSQAVTRMVTKATDRSLGIGATLGVNY
jgi:hypothetical protein